MKPASRPAAPILALGLSSLASGLASYVLIIVAARVLAPAANDEFALFWSLAVVVGLGGFLPLEQETARSGVAARRAGIPGARVVRAAVPVGLALAAVAVALTAVYSGVTSAGVVVVTGIAIAVVGYLPQYLVRGVLGSSRQLGRYAAVVAVEAGARLALAAAFGLAAVAGALWFCAIVGVAAGVSALAAVGSSRGRRAPEPEPSAAAIELGAGRFAGRVGLLAIAALGIQLLLNSPVLLSAGSVVGAGALLAAQSLARIPVFVYQAGQAAILPAIAEASHEPSRALARRRVGALVAGAVVVAGLLVAGAAVIGAPLLALLFGSELVAPHALLVAVAAAVGVFLVALCTSDALMALGTSHGWLVAAWGSGVVAAAVAWAVADGILRPAIPLAVGSFVALVVLTVRIIRVLRPTREESV